MTNNDLVLENLDRLLINSYAKIPKEKNIGILFSGGVDSSTIAIYASNLGYKPSLFTFGTDKSKDFSFAQKLAEDLKMPFYYLELKPEEIINTIPEINNLLKEAGIEPNIMQISLSIGFYLIAKLASEKGINLFLSGQGSDELFGGYNKYLKLNDKKLILQMQKDTQNLFNVDLVRDRLMTVKSQIDIYFPYLDMDFITYAQSLSLDLKIHGEIRKYILRELAKQNGLPDYIFNRPKNALQYSSGIQKIVEKYLKKNYLQTAS